MNFKYYGLEDEVLAEDSRHFFSQNLSREHLQLTITVYEVSVYSAKLVSLRRIGPLSSSVLVSFCCLDKYSRETKGEKFIVVHGFSLQLAYFTAVVRQNVLVGTRSSFTSWLLRSNKRGQEETRTKVHSSKLCCRDLISYSQPPFTYSSTTF